MNGPDASADDPPGAIGRPVYFFDVSEIRARLPDTADRASEAVDRLLAPHIDAAIGPKDVKIANGDGYFVLFGDLDARAAEAKAQSLANALLAKAFGGQRVPQNTSAFLRRSSLRAASEALRRMARTASRENNQLPEKSEAEGPAEIQSLEPALKHIREGRKFVFSPIWDSSVERVAGYLCHQRGQGAAYRVTNPAAQCDLDLEGLAAAREAALAFAESQTPALIRVGVHLETLAWSKQRDIYLQAVGDMGRDLLGFVAFEIVGFVEGSSLTQVSQAVAVLKRHAKRIFLRMPPTNMESALSGVVGVSALGLIAPLTTGDGPASLDTMVARLRRLCARQGAIPYIDRVDNGQALAIVRAAGIRLVTGDILPPEAEKPEGLYPLSFEDIVASAEEQAVAVG